MNDKTFKAIDFCYSYVHYCITKKCGNLWPTAAMLCKIADVEGWEISADVRKMVECYPDGMDMEFSIYNASKKEAKAHEKQYFQRRAELIDTLKSEIDKFNKIADQAEDELETEPEAIETK